METQPTLQHDADAEALTESSGEVLRAGMMDPEAWHDLAERGTPRNG